MTILLHKTLAKYILQKPITAKNVVIHANNQFRIWYRIYSIVIRP